MIHDILFFVAERKKCDEPIKLYERVIKKLLYLQHFVAFVLTNYYFGCIIRIENQKVAAPPEWGQYFKHKQIMMTQHAME